MSLCGTFLILAFTALLDDIADAYVIVAWVGLVVAGLSLARVSRMLSRRLDREDFLWLATLSVFSLVWLADVGRTGHWPVSIDRQGGALPFWPLLVVIFMAWWRRYPPYQVSIRVGIVLGALGAFMHAFQVRLIQGADRVNHPINAIPFGDLSLLFGILSLVFLLESISRPLTRFPKWEKAMFALSAFAGVGASLLSGTRGGWITLPVMAVLLYWAFRPVLSGRRLWGVAGVVGALLVGGTLLPQTGVTHRMDQAADHMHEYVAGQDADTSIGVRLDMWKAGLILFADKPIMGWGEARLQAARDELVARGVVGPGVKYYDQLHSDLIDTAARRGLVGLASLLLLYGVPLVLFTRHLRASSEPSVRAMAVSGLVVVVGFIGFGLSQSMLRDVHGLAGYLGMTVICWVLLKREVASSRPWSRSPC